MLNNFIYSRTKQLFEESLNNNEVPEDAIAFIEDAREIWNHGTYFCSDQKSGSLYIWSMDSSEGTITDEEINSIKNADNVIIKAGDIKYNVVTSRQIEDVIQLVAIVPTTGQHMMGIIIQNNLYSSQMYGDEAVEVIDNLESNNSDKALSARQGKVLKEMIPTDYISKELTNVTYEELKALRDGDQLNEGHLYRITDYVTTTTQSNTKSAGNVFDVIVLATSTNELSHNARAIQHEGDTYFDGNDLGAWELWYDLDNDTDKYEWADATNGKGVIYRMIDEKRNDCPYDFKNILFYNDKYTKHTTTDKYYFTFSYVVSGVLYDGTVKKQVVNCYGNEMGVYIKSNKKSLNINVFRNKGFSGYCKSNTFGNNCYANTFDDNWHANTFGNYCYANTFGYGCNANTFGNYCYANTFGNYCTLNTFGNYCTSNTFGKYCTYNTFGDNCYANTFGDDCTYNTFGYGCSNKRIDSIHTSITLNDEYYNDGSSQLVPIKHPDLSTQPSILPYKFMGQYVYEQLIFVGTFDKDNTNINRLIEPKDLIQRNVCIIKCEGFGFGNFNKPVTGLESGMFTNLGNMGIPINLSIKPKIYDSDGDFYITGSIPSDIGEFINPGASTVLGINTIKVYARIIYTIIPEDSSYYGYNNY